MTDPLIQKLDKRVKELRETPRFDGVIRTAADEEKINDLFRRVLSAGPGAELMDYLRSITLHSVMDVTAGDAELRDMEGRRRLFAIMDARRKSTPRGDA